MMPDTYPPKDNAMETALAALQEIARHEKECGRRWGDAHKELKIIRERLRAHSMRWERLAWMVIGTMTAGFIAVIIQSID
jgi:hypothetical protein|tara:strand:- start:10443 stop:10682 length:240 start_codon:yes stop_codon:yes gene_type:complete